MCQLGWANCDKIAKNSLPEARFEPAPSAATAVALAANMAKPAIWSSPCKCRGGLAITVQNPIRATLYMGFLFDCFRGCMEVVELAYTPASDTDETSTYSDQHTDTVAVTTEAPSKKRCRKAFEKEVRDREKHPAILVACSSSKCKRNCEQCCIEDRAKIWDEFWKMPYEKRRHWLSAKVRMFTIRRRSVRSSSTSSFVRNESRHYFLPKRSGVLGCLQVWKTCKSQGIL